MLQLGPFQQRLASGSMAVLCEARAYMEDEYDQMRTKTLIMNPMWARYGEE